MCPLSQPCLSVHTHPCPEEPCRPGDMWEAACETRSPFWEPIMPHSRWKMGDSGGREGENEMRER